MAPASMFPWDTWRHAHTRLPARRLRGRRHRHGGLRGEQEKRDRFLQVQADGCIGMTEIADGDVLADVQLEIAAARGEDKGARNGRSPEDLVGNETLDMRQ